MTETLKTYAPDHLMYVLGELSIKPLDGAKKLEDRLCEETMPEKTKLVKRLSLPFSLLWIVLSAAFVIYLEPSYGEDSLQFWAIAIGTIFVPLFAAMFLLRDHSPKAHFHNCWRYVEIESESIPDRYLSVIDTLRERLPESDIQIKSFFWPGYEVTKVLWVKHRSYQGRDEDTTYRIPVAIAQWHE